MRKIVKRIGLFFRGMGNGYKQLVRFLRHTSMARIVAALLIIGMAYSDYTTMAELFRDLDFTATEREVLAMTIALCLEGIPSFLGVTLSKLLDYTIYKRNNKKNAQIGTWVTLAGVLLTFAIVIGMRVAVWVFNNGADIEIDEVGQYWAKNIYVTFSPIMTSVLSFIASWVVFGSDSLEQARKDRDDTLQKYMERESDFQASLHQVNDARNALWSSMCVNTPMPQDFGVFRKECFMRIRNKLTENTLEAYPDQLSKYNSEVKAELIMCLNELQNLSGIEAGYKDLTMEAILKGYDDKILENKKDIDAWSLDRAEELLKKELARLIDNAVIVAQYKSAVKPYHLEKNRW